MSTGSGGNDMLRPLAALRASERGSKRTRTTRGPRTLIGALVAAVVGASVVILGTVVAGGTAGAASSGAASGTVKISADLSGINTGEPITFDPTLGVTYGEQDPWEMAIYSTLLRPTPSGAVVPELATNVTILNPQTVTIQLRKGAVFSDGTPFNSQAVMAGLLRNRDATTTPFLPALKTIAGIDTPTSTSLTVHLSQPDAGAFYAILSDSDAFIPSPAAVAAGNLNTAPIGAGPFILKKYVPNSMIVLDRNPKYWDTQSIHVNEVQYVNVPGGAQQLTSLESGLVDVSQLPVDALAAVRNNSAFNVISVQSQASSLWMPVCKTQAPLDNVQVRQALSYAIDRKAINTAVLGGTGEPQWALWPQSSILFPKNLKNYYAYNPKKAKALLKQAGFPNGFNIQLAYISTSPSVTETAQIVQQQWKQVGVNASLVPTQNIISDFYQRHVAPIAVSPGVKAGLGALTGPFSHGAIGDTCGYDSPNLDAIINQLSALPPTSNAAVSLWYKAENFVVTNALGIWIAFEPQVFGASKHVGGVQFLVATFPLPIIYYWSLSVHGS